MSIEGVCWIEGDIVPVHQARISVLDHGLLYGDGVFEGIRFYQNKPFLLPAHLQRLVQSARAIALSVPWSAEELALIVRNVINAFDQPDGYLRLVITRGKGSLGINPATCPTPELIVIASKLQMIDEQTRNRGVRTIIACTRRLPPDGLDPRIKSLNYLNHILARIEANRSGAEEALMLNQQGYVAEGSADNVFIVHNNQLLTPPTHDGALNGITRGLVLRLASEAGITAREQSLAPYDIYTANECFLTGTGAELIPVREVDGRVYSPCPGPMFQKLSHAFQQFIDSGAWV